MFYIINNEILLILNEFLMIIRSKIFFEYYVNIWMIFLYFIYFGLNNVNLKMIGFEKKVLYLEFEYNLF